MNWEFVKKHNIVIQLLLLCVVMTGLSLYSMFAQRALLLQQMQRDSQDVAHSINAAIARFQAVKATMSLQKLVHDISFGLEIFEFRFIDKNGIVLNSMFGDELNKKYNRQSFLDAMNDPAKMNAFYFDERDFTPVMAITYPVTVSREIVGYIDLSLEISEYDHIKGQKPSFAIERRQVDIRNLLTAMTGSIRNSIEIFKTAEINDFLNGYVKTTKNVRQISLADSQGKVLMSSSRESVGGQESRIPSISSEGELIEQGGESVYRLAIPTTQFGGASGNLLLVLDATPYSANEKRLITVWAVTGFLTMMMALFIAYSIYSYNLDQARKENRRLEQMVAERTREIEILSNTDGLTGLWNRRYLEEILDRECQRAKRYGHELTILMLDLDHFKHVNDTYGHRGGDEVLRESARRVKTALRQTDFVGRYGGEEIVVVLTDTNRENALTVAEKICRTIADTPVNFEGQQIPVTTSIGASAMVSANESVHDILERADAALYHSKRDGRNRVTVIDGPPEGSPPPQPQG